MICKSLFIKSKGVFDGRKQWRCQKRFLENSDKFNYASFDQSRILSTDRMYFSIDRIGFKNQSNEAEAKW